MATTRGDCRGRGGNALVYVRGLEGFVALEEPHSSTKTVAGLQSGPQAGQTNVRGDVAGVARYDNEGN
jgi:hypothetical protein